ncbi:MAG: NAD(P)-dependent oxidoreductase [Anaeromyxobacter sp.]|nr:NAD(P)-dependent oxidoreductase [Anaeromyxobacter sp.]
MTSALVGHSGFVGETLKRQATWDELYRSTDIEAIEGRSFDLVVCAGAPAAKWKANREPQADLENLQRLQRHLGRVKARRFVLISTVDVYPAPAGVDEDSSFSPDPANAYGTNRLALERYCRLRFDATVVRLPALFGAGLRKNAVYDLLNENGVELLQPRSEFQFYDMAELWVDLTRIQDAGLKLVNLATEPTSLADVARIAFGRRLEATERSPVVRYDFRTKHASIWGRAGGYAYGREEILERLQAFVATSRELGRPA